MVVTTLEHEIVIEYDGAYWHQGREVPDERKSQAIRVAGYKLVRVRQAPLGVDHQDDVSVDQPEPQGLASAVLEHLIAKGWLNDPAIRAAHEYIDAGVELGKAQADKALRDVAFLDLGDRSLAATHPNLAEEWDHDANGPLLPQHVTADRSTPVGWRCPEGDTYTATPSDRANRKRSCPYCRGKKVNARTCLATTFPEIAAELSDANPVTAWDLHGGGHRVVEWRCSKANCSHVWTASVKQRTAKDTGCPACAGKVATQRRNLASDKPDAASLWHPTKNADLTPRDVLPGSNKAVWWLCPECGADFHGSVVDRCAAAHQTCGACARVRSARMRRQGRKA